LLTNIHNATPTIDDWNLLQSRTDIFLSIEERQRFDTSIHLFATNILVDNHNKFMLQSLNMPIARSVAELLGASEAHQQDDDQLEKHVLLCIGQRVMLSCNLWVQAGLVNGALGVVMQIVYTPGSSPPNFPTYVVVAFDKYIGPPWDQTQPKHVPIPPIQRGNKKQIPLKMAWALTIHKSQGMTLTRSTIDIGNIERQGLTFTTMSHTTTIEGM
jgi:ATP-dependent DNA helicase PIF1